MPPPPVKGASRHCVMRLRRTPDKGRWNEGRRLSEKGEDRRAEALTRGDTALVVDRLDELRAVVANVPDRLADRAWH